MKVESRMSENLLTSASSTNTSLESLEMSSAATKDFYIEAR